MKKLTLLLLAISLIAGIQRLSPIPLPKTYFLDLDIYPCDSYCLQEHLQRGEIFSFLAKADPKSEEFAERYKEYARLFNLPWQPSRSFKLTLITFRGLERLAQRNAKAMALKLLRSGAAFTIDTRYVQDSLQESIDEAQSSDLIVLLLPYSKASELEAISSQTPIFVPTLNKRLIQQSGAFYFGGIDYLDQIDQLLRLSQHRLAIFYIPQNPLSQALTEYAEQKKEARKFALKNRGTNLKWTIKSARDLNSSDLLLNTPVVTSALILSQLTLYSYEPPLKLSTQINYNPKIFELTQKKDRKNLFIANSILDLNNEERALGMIFDIDLDYEWLVYAEYAAIENLLLGSPQKPFVDRQLRYDTKIFKVEDHAFVPIHQENMEGFSQDVGL